MLSTWWQGRHIDRLSMLYIEGGSLSMHVSLSFANLALPTPTSYTYHIVTHTFTQGHYLSDKT